ncbi:MAG: hypothetical protein Q8R55_06995 [Candidatus Taylorbacteria bacterium]|nr:hypothetical protein [Candidatus Taylorbacteria bacterium]
MIVLKVEFRPYTSYEWATERMTEIGLHYTNVIHANYGSQFMLVSNLNGFHALVGISEEQELQISRDLRLIPQVISVEEHRRT